VRRVTVWLRPRQFHDSAGVGDWRVLASSVAAHFRTGSFAVGVALVDAIAALGELGSAAPEVDLRHSGVTVRLVGDIEHGLREEYVELARRISAAAAELGAVADPGAVQEVQITIDALDIGAVRAFWQAVLGYREVGEEDLLDPLGHGPSLWFQQLDAPRPQRNRMHVDVFIPPDQAERRVAAALTAGGRLIDDRHAPTWWALADPEGNEVDVATWLGRD
jgi:4a-hydroxytetrahydrobiopterin dehydratase